MTDTRHAHPSLKFGDNNDETEGKIYSIETLASFYNYFRSTEYVVSTATQKQKEYSDLVDRYISRIK